jgi:hypothetical protein
MREGIYRIETTKGQMSSNGVAMINNGRIRGLDINYVYAGNQVTKNGMRGWSFSAEKYSESGSGSFFRHFSATVYGEEAEEEFRLSGELDGDASMKVAIHGQRVADP